MYFSVYTIYFLSLFTLKTKFNVKKTVLKKVYNLGLKKIRVNNKLFRHKRTR